MSAQERQWKQWETRCLNDLRCPYSGGALRAGTDEAPDGLACNVCDCFGFATDEDGEPISHMEVSQ